MSYPVYMVPSGDVLPIFFSTYGKTNGESITMTGLAVTDIEIYKDGGVTQRASDAGYVLLDTDGIDFDTTTGIHGFSIDTGDNTDAGFYTVGAWFHVVISAVTVDAQTVNFIAAAFRLMAAESVAGVPKVDPSTWDGTDITTGVPLAPTVAGRTLDVSAGGEAGLDWANIGSPTTVQGLSGTTVKTATDVETDTADIQTRLPAALVSSRMDSSVGAYASGMTPTRPSASGTADSGSTTTLVDAERTEADTDYWRNCILKFTSGTLNGQTALITAFNAATDTITFAPASTVAVGTHTYEIYPMSRVDVHLWLGVLVNALIAGRMDANVQAMANAVVTALTFAAGALDAAALAQDAAREIADEVLNRDIAGGASGGARNVRSALRRLRNRVAIAAGTATIYQENDTTADWTAAVTTTAGDPVSQVDPT